MFWNQNFKSLTKPAGCSGPKLTVDFKIKTWYPFLLQPQICVRGGKSKATFSFDFVYSLWLLYRNTFKIEKMYCFPDQNNIMHYRYLSNNLHSFFKFLDPLIYVLFCPARGFSPSPAPRWGPSLPRPTPLENTPPRTSLLYMPLCPKLLKCPPQTPLEYIGIGKGRSSKCWQRPTGGRGACLLPFCSFSSIIWENIWVFKFWSDFEVSVMVLVCNLDQAVGISKNQFWAITFDWSDLRK